MTEHSGSIFVFFFLAEYSALVFLSTFISLLFLGGYLLPIDNYLNIILNLQFHPIINNILAAVSLSIKVSLLIFIFIWIRASFPRFRFDQLIYLCWTALLPLVFAFLLVIPIILLLMDMLPFNTLIPNYFIITYLFTYIKFYTNEDIYIYILKLH